MLFGTTSVHRSFKVPTTVVNLPTTTEGLGLNTRYSNAAREFSMLVGGGLDVRLHDRVSFRPIKLNHYLTRFQPIFVEGYRRAQSQPEPEQPALQHRVQPSRLDGLGSLQLPVKSTPTVGLSNVVFSK